MSYWGELDCELLDLILSNLFGKDRLSFRLVCGHWNAVAAASPYRYSPCLMYYYQRTRIWKFYMYNTFFNMSFPELENAEIRCSKHGWLLMSRHEGTLFFFDPSNSQKVRLPCKAGHGYTSLSFFNPPTSPECVVVGINTPFNKREVIICTLKRGEDKWKSMKHPTDEPISVSMGAPVLHRGLIYFLSTKGDVAVLDIKQHRLNVYSNCMGRMRKKSDMPFKEQYLVKVNGEESLFGVFVLKDDGKVNLFRLSYDTKWHPVKGIGDNVMYVSHTSSFGDKAHTKSLENTICFPKFHGDDAVLYSLSNGKYHSLGRDYSESNAYGLKQLHFSAWLMPLPSQELTTTLSWL